MEIDELIVVSIDDHVVEPPDMFVKHVPEKYANEAPRVVRQADGHEAWIFQDRPMAMHGLNSVVTWPKDEWGMDPTSIAEMRPGTYDVHERIRDMNRNGVLASLCFPTMPGFSGRLFLDMPDRDSSLVMLRAYNDWHIDEWCASYPGRFIPNAIVPLWDPHLLADEVRRVASKGCSSISLPELPHLLGLPGYGSLDYWDPCFTACCDSGVTINLHIGHGMQALSLAPDSPAIDSMMVLATQVSVLSVQDLLWGQAMRKYAPLKVAWSEGGIGWVPFFLDRVDRQHLNQSWTGQDFGGKLPSEVFREHALACFIWDPTSLKLHSEIGVDILAFETDYPHSDGLWPDAPEELMAQCTAAALSDADIHKISWQNASRFYNYDPFNGRAREEATVGALRRLAGDVDTGPTSKHEYRARYEQDPRYAVEDAPDVAVAGWHT